MIKIKVTGERLQATRHVMPSVKVYKAQCKFNNRMIKLALEDGQTYKLFKQAIMRSQA